MNKCIIPAIIDKQRGLKCGKHAINNLLQENIASTNILYKIGRKLSKAIGIGLTEMVDKTTGYYDVNVLLFFLKYRGYQVEQIHFDNKRDVEKMSTRQSNRLIGYIIGTGMHWYALRRMRNNGCYYIIDSLETEVMQIKSLRKWINSRDDLILALKIFL